MSQSKNPKAKKAISIIGNVLLYLFIALCVLMVISTIITKKKGEDAVTVFGYQMRVVMSNSMEESDKTDVSDFKIKSIDVRSMVFIKTVPKDSQKSEEFYNKITEGDVLTFQYSEYANDPNNEVVVTHRVVEKTQIEGGYIIKLAGDNYQGERIIEEINTTENGPDYIIGKVVGQSKVLGLIAYSLKQWYGLVFIVILPCLIMIVYQVISLSGYYSNEKNKKSLEEQKRQKETIDSQKEELEELKAQLAQLKGEQEVTTKMESTATAEGQSGENN